MKLYKIEALRGFAAFYVLLHHTIPAKSVNIFGHNFGFLFRFGQEAVILFFLLSGFVINYSYKKSSDKSFKTYFFNRFLRIYIPLIIVFITTYLLAAHSAKSWIDPQIKTLVLNLLMLQDWEAVKPNVLASAYMGNTPLWSLSYEWWFYMLYFPIIKCFKDSLRHPLVFAIVLLSTALYVYQPIFPFRILAYLGIWWAGVYLSDLYMENKLKNTSAYCLPVLGLILPICILSYSMLAQRAEGTKLLLGLHPVLEVRHFMFALVAVLGSVAWRKINWIGFDLLFKPFLFLAPISYALYISHLPLMADAFYLDMIQSPALRWAAYLFCVIAFSYIVEITIYRTIRQKARLWINHT